MSCADQVFVDIGLRGSTFDAAHRSRLADVVDLTDHRQYRTVDVVQRHEIAVDGEAAGHHAVVRDELFEQFGDCGAGPGDPSLGGQEPPLLLAGQQCLAVVQLAQEVQTRLGGLDGVEHLEPGACEPARDVDAAEDVVGHEVGGTGGQPGRQVHRQCGQRVDRRAERDDAGEVLGPAERRGLVAEHAALRVAGQVNVAPGGVLDGVDGLAERHHVVGKVALHPALDLVGFAEVDDPRVDARAVQNADSALVTGDVPHVGRHHHRMHHQHRRPRGFRSGPGVGREVPAQPVHRDAFDDLERRRNSAGLQAAVAQHFETVLCRGHQSTHWPRYCRKVHHRRFPSSHTCPPIAEVIMAQSPWQPRRDALPIIGG